jgi:hypothetical protein
MSKNSVPLSAHKFIIAPSELLQENRDYIWIFMILLEKASNSKAASISGSQLIEASRLTPQQVRDALQWLRENGYVKKTVDENENSIYLLSVEGAFPPDLSRYSYASEALRKANKSVSLPPVKQGSRKFVATPFGTPSIPPQLSSVASIICDFFNDHKGGVKSKRSFDSLLNSLMQIFDDKGGGIDAVKQQLELAIERSKSGEKKWDSITYSNWDKFGRKKQQHWEQNSRPSTERIVNMFEEDLA